MLDEHVATAEAEHRFHRRRVAGRIVLPGDEPTARKASIPVVPVVCCRRYSTDAGERNAARGHTRPQQNLATPQCAFTHRYLPWSVLIQTTCAIVGPPTTPNRST